MYIEAKHLNRTDDVGKVLNDIVNLSLADLDDLYDAMSVIDIAKHDKIVEEIEQLLEETE